MENSLAPPGETTQINAKRVLVLAPHYDDDVLGCGGLLAQLADTGAEILVLYISDSRGGAEVTTDRDAYARTRREETVRSLAKLGVHEVRDLGLPDGELDQHIAEAAAGISKGLLEHRPDLLLSLSPLEITSDHQAVFSALHSALTPLRDGDELFSVCIGCQILLYEINHPAYPDLLVDVSHQEDRLKAAIQEHASQLALHNYLDAAIGGRRYRTLSLPATISLAEGFRELALEDFTTRSLSGLIHALGGRPELHAVVEGPTISVVVRTRDRPQLLAEALASIAAGTYRRLEVVLVNDGGCPPEIDDRFPFPVAHIHHLESRGRAAAANAGVQAATGEFVAFLDDDDVVEAEHFATLAGLVGAQGVRVAYTDAAIGIYELDGEHGWQQLERRLPYSRDFDPDLLLFDNYIPFNTLLIERSLFAAAGPFADDLQFFEDWDFLVRLARVVPFHHHGCVTCEYRHFRGAGHHILGDRPRERADFLAMKADVIERHESLHTPELLARVVDRLRGEAVEQAEAGAGRVRELAATTRRLAELESSFHRLNGELYSLRGLHEALQEAHGRLEEDRDRVAADAERLAGERDRHRGHAAELELKVQELFDQEKELRDTVDDQEDHLSRLYAEIERLDGAIREMQSTRVWKLHRFFQGRRSD